MMTPRELSRDLRYGAHPHLARRRTLFGLALVAAGAMSMVGLYQMGILRHVPEPVLPGLDADRVDASDEAYAHAHTPDAVLGFRSYATTAALAAAGGSDRTWRTPWLPLALAAKVLFDATVAGKLTWDQWSKHRAFCSWCLTAAAATFAMVPLVLPEARDALAAARAGKGPVASSARSVRRRVQRAVGAA